MSDPAAAAAAASAASSVAAAASTSALPHVQGPVRRLRITLWGVQGSCPIFPTPVGIREYSRRVAVYTLTRALEELRRRADADPEGRVSLRDLIEGPVTRSTIEQFQRNVIGLPDLPFYGGETTCIEVETNEGNKLIFDAGSGIRRCSLEVVQQWAEREDRTLHLFGSHEHLDHRMGLTFARFCYVGGDRPYTLHVYGGARFLGALDDHYGLFSRRIGERTYVDDPVDFTMMPARFVGHELRPEPVEGGAACCAAARNAQGIANGRAPGCCDVLPVGRPIRIGRTVVTPFEVYHAIPLCLGYKVEHDGATFVFATDHELRRGPDPSDERQRRSEAAEATLMAHCRDADLAYVDGQYFLEEYLGNQPVGSGRPVPRIDWGHSCVEDVVDRAFRCNTRRTLIGHHDPERTWPDRLEIDRQLSRLSRGRPNRVQLADSDTVIDL